MIVRADGWGVYPIYIYARGLLSQRLAQRLEPSLNTRRIIDRGSYEHRLASLQKDDVKWLSTHAGASSLLEE